ncbi:MAG: tRNA pseudouridine(38-40) synthase TruA [Alphaproteobacteria bacterium]|nr:tRNA pseudouridine(38-40) synthase TruA [Alphaproteobacteria bacterium SS10]
MSAEEPSEPSEPLQRWKLTIEYDGGNYLGWQRQEHGPSIQGELEAAMAKFVSGEAPDLYVCGRTDAGVHALGQVAHVDLPPRYDAKAVRDATNFHLGEAPIAVLTAEQVDDAFHARLSAKGRAYQYRILNRRAPPGLDVGRVWHLGAPLDVEAMVEAAKHLIGHHDFTSFRATHCQAKSPEKTLDRLDVSKRGEEIWIEAEARSFLHHQVRNMVGTLRDFGTGRFQPAEMKKILGAKDRSAAGQTAPSDGLYFVRAMY